jgi:hypothetical protein
MKTIKKRPPRPPAKSLRKRFLYTDVTPEEHEEIQQYCRGKGITVSQFLADLLLKDALESKRKPNDTVTLTPEIQLTPRQQEKLEALTRLHQKKSIGEYILDILQPELELQRIHVPVKTKRLRYYLSEEEHQTLSSHLSASGLSPSDYAAMLALRTVRKERKKS